jgi:hypothetical protein
MFELDQYCEREYTTQFSESTGKPKPETTAVTGFDWNELFRRLDGEEEEEKSTAAVSGEALITILSWVVGDRPTEKDSPFGISGRGIALLWLLRPSLVPGFKGLSDIAAHCAVTKQCLSKALAEFKQEAKWKHAKHFKLAPPDCYQESGRQGWKTRLANLQKRKESAAAPALSEA